MRELLFFFFSIFVVLFLLFSLIQTELKVQIEDGNEIETKLILFDLFVKKIKANVSFVKIHYENVSIGLEIHERDVLSFGVVPLSSGIEGIRREIKIKNFENIKIKTKIKCEGKICDFIEIKEDSFILNPQEERKIVFRLRNNDVEGLFEGYIYIYFFKPKNRLCETFLYLI